MKYIGDGSAIQGIPARDLTADEVKLYGEAVLLASGLYEKEKQAYSKPVKNKEGE